MASTADSGYRYTRLTESPTSSTQFVADTLQKQQVCLEIHLFRGGGVKMELILEREFIILFK